MNANNSSTHDLELGIDAYGGSETSTADLFQNLKGCTVHRFAEGTDEHAGTAMMVVELPTGEGLGVQVSMEAETSHTHIHPSASQQGEDSWAVNPDTERLTLTAIEEPCPDCTIVGVASQDIMIPDDARVAVILDSDLRDEPYALDIHIGESGGTEFFEVEL